VYSGRRSFSKFSTRGRASGVAAQTTDPKAGDQAIEVARAKPRQLVSHGLCWTSRAGKLLHRGFDEIDHLLRRPAPVTTQPFEETPCPVRVLAHAFGNVTIERNRWINKKRSVTPIHGRGMRTNACECLVSPGGSCFYPPIVREDNPSRRAVLVLVEDLVRDGCLEILRRLNSVNQDPRRPGMSAILRRVSEVRVSRVPKSPAKPHLKQLPRNPGRCREW